MHRKVKTYRLLSLFFLTCVVLYSTTAYAVKLHEPPVKQEQKEGKKEQKKGQESVSAIQDIASVHAQTPSLNKDWFLLQNIEIPKQVPASPVVQQCTALISYYVNLFTSSICIHAP